MEEATDIKLSAPRQGHIQWGTKGTTAPVTVLKAVSLPDNYWLGKIAIHIRVCMRMCNMSQCQETFWVLPHSS